MQKKAIITGNGQDSTHLSSFLLDKGYSVILLTRRSGSNDFWRLREEGILNHENLKIEYCDITEKYVVEDFIIKYRPDEFYHLAAMSFVQTSFEHVHSTFNSNLMGYINILEAIRKNSPDTKVYFASSSETFGKVQEIPQTEKTPFYPRSPYGVTKLSAYWIGKNYRESYGMFVSNGILFNHETMASFLPIFVKEKNSDIFDIKPIEEIYEFDKNKNEYQKTSIKDIQVWGKNNWVDVTYASAYPHDIKNDNKKPKIINGRCGAYLATGSHISFLKDREEKSENIKLGDKFEIIDLPKNIFNYTDVTLEEAELLGMLVADGYIDKRFSNSMQGKFTKNDKIIQERFKELWHIVTGDKKELKSQETESGFKKGNYVTQILFSTKSEKLLKYNIYNKDRTKRIPIQILNSSKDIQLAFLKSYNKCDGLKAGHCKYEFKSFKTNSATLAQGLWYLTDILLSNQKKTLNIEFKKEEKRIYYSINLGSELNYFLENNKKIILNAKKEGMSQRELHRQTGINRGFIRRVWHNENYIIKRKLEKPFEEIKKIIEFYDYEGWFYDITTSSKEFCCGIGNIHVHNSPYRGAEFVTRKITKSIAEIDRAWMEGYKPPVLTIGNMYAKRDWGYAGDYILGMYKMLQHDIPDDFVLATNTTYTVKDFINESYNYICDVPLHWVNEHQGVDEYAIDFNDNVVVRVSEEFFRPCEVDILIGDYSKAKEKLGWEPRTDFRRLVEIMVNADMRRLSVI